MCILFLIADGNPVPGGYKLILASNRDEFYTRPALPAAPWVENPFVYGGRDSEPGREGGTWLALGTRGGTIRIGALLNVTGESRKKSASGRGSIVSNYVCGHTTNEEYSRSLIDNNDMYNAFNLVTVEINKESANIMHCSNAPNELKLCSKMEALGFGNSPITNPLEKVKSGTNMFRDIIENCQGQKDVLVDKLMELLQSREKCWPDEELSRRAPTWGEQLSSICVKMPQADYGTRTRTVILIDWQNRMDMFEETMLTPDPDNEWKKSHIFRQL